MAGNFIGDAEIGVFLIAVVWLLAMAMENIENKQSTMAFIPPGTILELALLPIPDFGHLAPIAAAFGLELWKPLVSLP